MIVGADGEDDAAVLGTSAALYEKFGLRRVYYSAFSPIPDASRNLPAKAPPLERENRLYQADWLLRHYGFGVDEIVAGGEGGMLDLAVDPKTAWALKNRHRFPVDVNAAEREMLLRVPGLGVRAVDKILAARRHTRLRLADIARLTGALRRAQAFIVAEDHRPAALDRADLRARLTPPARQLSLFP
jgi:predicted DNA-binding helix-hairpin-helix protein